MRIGAALLHTPSEPIVDDDVHRARTMRTRGRNLDLQSLIPKAPFDEGRGTCVLRSRAADALAGAESQAMRRPGDRHGEGPRHGAGGVAHHEEQVPLEIVEHRDDAAHGEMHGRGNPLRRERRPAGAWQLANDKVPHGAVIGRHERQGVVLHAARLYDTVLFEIK
jgi:hypothetical protein